MCDRTNRLRDALDPLNNVCYIQDRSRTCLEETGISDYCLAEVEDSITVQFDFQFMCHHGHRDENLVRSLECLYDSRVLAMLYFHIADRCRGMSILDNIMTRNKNAYFIYSISTLPLIILYYLLKSVIFTCIRDIVDDHCGKMTADFVQDYLVYIQDRYAKALQSVGLDSNICDLDISSDILPSRTPGLSGQANTGFSTLLKTTPPGTALGTIQGEYLVTVLHRLSGEDLCSTENVIFAYYACVMSSDDTAEKRKSNILQFAHLTLPIFLYHGAHCNRLEQFTTCWNLLRDICKHKVQGFEQHATLLVEGCKIQTEMDSVECQWQDILLPHYIQASHTTVWPTVAHCLNSPLFIDNGHYSNFNSVMDDMDTLISLLQSGVEEISRKCSPRSANKLRALFKKIRSLQYDAAVYRNELMKAMLPYNIGGPG